MHTPTRPPRIRSFGFTPDDFDSSDATAWLADHEQPASPQPAAPKFARPGELTDLDLLPKRFDMFAREVRDALKSICGQLLPLITEVRAEQARSAEREAVRDEHVVELAHVSAEHGKRLDRIEQHLGLEPMPLPPLSSLPARPKRITLKR